MLDLVDFADEISQELQRFPRLREISRRGVVVGPESVDPVGTAREWCATHQVTWVVFACAPGSLERVAYAARHAAGLPEHVAVVESGDWQGLQQRIAEFQEQPERSSRPDPLEPSALLDALFENAPIGLGFWDRDLRFVRVNTALAEINGVPVSAHLGHTIAELLPGVDTRVTEAFRHVIKTGEAILNQEASGETPARPGTIRYWNVSYYPVRMGDRIVGAGAVCEEITGRKRAEWERNEFHQRERAARQSAEAAESRAGFLAEAATILGSSLDYSATLARVARLATPRIADGCMVDLLRDNGQLVRLVSEYHDPCQAEVAADIDQRFSPRELLPVRRVLARRRGEIVEIAGAEVGHLVQNPDHANLLRRLALSSLMALPLMDRERMLGVVTLVRCHPRPPFVHADLRMAEELADRAAVAIENATLFAAVEKQRTEAEQALEQLRRVNSELEEFAYIASHDLQEPLRTIASYTQLLERRYRGRLDRTADEFIDAVVGGVTRMRDLIQDLLGYSRVARDEAPPSERVNLEQAVQSSLEMLAAAVLESGATVTHGPLPVLGAASRAQLEQLFQNLISNAIKYRRPGTPPRVRITADRVGEMWHLHVGDNGQGFDPQFSERIFGIFKRLHGRDVPGTGIGLALCRRIVERHGGRIWAEAVPGQGATFHFTLPAGAS